MRIQILELPRKTVDDETPFTVVVSEYDAALLSDDVREQMRALIIEQTGARGCVFYANDIAIGESVEETAPKPSSSFGDVTIHVAQDKKTPEQIAADLNSNLGVTREHLRTRTPDDYTYATGGQLRPNYHEDTRLVDLVARMCYENSRSTGPWVDQTTRVQEAWRRLVVRELKDCNR